MKKVFTIQRLTILALLLAVNVILSIVPFLSIHTSFFKMNFSFLTLVIGGAVLGPVEAALIGAGADILVFFLQPVGPFFPGFTITAFITGIVYGLFFKEKITRIRNLGATAIVQFIIGLGANTYCLSLLYGKGYFALLPGRIAQALILFVVQFVVIELLNKYLIPKLKSIVYNHQ